MQQDPLTLKQRQKMEELREDLRDLIVKLEQLEHDLSVLACTHEHTSTKLVIFKSGATRNVTMCDDCGAEV